MSFIRTVQCAHPGNLIAEKPTEQFSNAMCFFDGEITVTVRVHHAENCRYLLLELSLFHMLALSVVPHSHMSMPVPRVVAAQVGESPTKGTNLPHRYTV